MKTSLKILSVVLIVVMIMIPLSASFGITFEDVTRGGDTGEFDGTITDLGGTAFKIAQNVGIAIAVVIVVVFGVQWLIATPAKKAELKGKLWNILIGLILIFGGVAILGWMQNLIESNIETTGSSSRSGSSYVDPV